MKNTSGCSPGLANRFSASTAPACAIASTCSTPGMIGCPGKCPAKYGSLALTFLSATTLSSRSSMTRSINRKGKRCGMTRSIAGTSSGAARPSGTLLLGAAGLRIVGADDLVGDVEGRLAVHHRRAALEHHDEVFALGDLLHHRRQLGQNAARRLGLALLQVTLKTRVGLLQLHQALLHVLLHLLLGVFLHQ